MILDETAFIEQVKKYAFRDSALCQRGLPYPVAEQEVVKAESVLNFRLPDLLRRLYLEVADGGFGPGLGISFPGGIFRLARAEKYYISHRNDKPGGENWEDGDVEWPEGLLPICDWGCGRFSSIDCTHLPYPVVYHHAEFREFEGGIGTCPGFDQMQQRLDEHGFFVKFGHLYGSSWVVAKSLRAWLTAWMDDQQVETLGYPHEQDQNTPYME